MVWVREFQLVNYIDTVSLAAVCRNDFYLGLPSLLASTRAAHAAGQVPGHQS